jgi:adenylate kinase family enzyme
MMNKPGWQNHPPSLAPQPVRPPPPKENIEELSEAEKKFDKQFAEWEAQFNKWKEQNAEHPDKEQYREYEKKWESWRAQLLERREQMKRKRLGLVVDSPNKSRPSSQQGLNQSYNSPQQTYNQPPPKIGQNVPPKTGLLPTPSASFNKPPPNLNDEPLKFKDSKPVPEPDEAVGDFIKPNTSGGIPGLDLVRDDPKPKKDTDDVVVIDSEDKERRGPDFDAISKGINTILGDQKLLNMLSMVSQTQNPKINDNLTNTTSRIKDNSNPEMNPHPTYQEQSNQSYGEHSNHSEAHDQRELVNNFDDQTRSSFTMAHNEQEMRFDGGFGRNPKFEQNQFQNRFGGFGKGGRFGAPENEFNNFGNRPDSSERFPPKGDRFPPVGGERFGPNQERLGPNPERFGPNQERFGPNQERFGPNQERFGPNQERFGPNQERFGPNHERFGPNQERFGPNQERFGPNQERFGPNQERFGPNQERFGPNQERFGPGQDRFVPNPERFGPERFESNQDRFGPNQERFRTNQNRFGPNQGRYGSNQEKFGPNHNRFGQDRFGPNQDRFGSNQERFPSEDRFGAQRNDFRPEERFPRGNNNWNNERNFGPKGAPPKSGQFGFGDDDQGQFEDFDQGPPCEESFDNYSYDRMPPKYEEEPPVAPLQDEDVEEPWKEENYQESKIEEVAVVPEPTPPAPPEKENIFQPATVIDYEHKPPKIVDPEILLEPIYMFDYRHKALSRIPLPQRPKWLLETVKNIKEFDPPVVRQYEPPNLRRYPPPGDNWRKDRYQESWPPHGRRNYGGRSPFEERRPYERPYEESRTAKNDWNSVDSRKREEKRSFSDSRDDKKHSFQPMDYEEEKISDTEWPEDEDEQFETPSVQFQKPESNKTNSSKKSAVLIEDLISPPGRYSRPPRIVIILRGPPGSGKTFLAKLIKDKEVENGGSTPRILSLDDYFMVEQEKEVTEEGKRVKIKEMVYEFEAEMEESYRTSLIKSFKKTVTDGYFSFIIVDNINDKVKYFGEMWSFAKQNGFQVYICQLDLDVQTCSKRNIHGRSEADIEKCVSGWEATPSHHPVLDATSLLQSASIPEVEMEEVNSPESDVNENDDGSEVR